MLSIKRQRIPLKVPIGAVLLLLLPVLIRAQTAAKAKESASAAGTAEQRTARAYDAARAKPLDLEAFLRRMPKGSDLHYHFSGGIYAETWIRDAAEDGLCVDLAGYAVTAACQQQPHADEGAGAKAVSSARERGDHPAVRPRRPTKARETRAGFSGSPGDHPAAKRLT